ncbi:MAG TPA: glycine hydroxymethyltransferase [Chloroflexota bacterium]|nr:glycine hydroxymethyltransferase [Chloroflexota bacterium]
MATTIGENRLLRYLDTRSGQAIDASAAAVYAALDAVAGVSPTVAGAVTQELHDQRTNLKLIASENYSSLATQLAQGTLLNDKYAEGYPYHRFYAGCDNVDIVEAEAADLACRIFGARHAYVQPHSGADANLVAYLAILSAKVETPILEKLGQTDPTKLSREQWQDVRSAFLNQRLLGMDYYSGGHLTHGYRHNVSSLLFDAFTYSVDPDTRLLNLDRLREQAREVRPLILLAGYSAYSRKINFAHLRTIADDVGAVLMVDMAHFAGLVAGKVFTGDYDPVAHAQVVTTTTHKTLRGPRGGMVLCTDEYADYVNKGCPMVLGGPLPHVLAAKAVALREAAEPAFQEYARAVVRNAQSLADACLAEGIDVLTGGTDNHLLLLDVASSFGLTGRQAESALRDCHLTLNRNALPFDPNGPWYTSGLRLGTPAATTLGMGAEEMREIARVIKLVLGHTRPATVTKGAQAGQPSKARYEIEPSAQDEARHRVADVLSRFPVYPELDLDILMSAVPAQSS